MRHGWSSFYDGWVEDTWRSAKKNPWYTIYVLILLFFTATFFHESSFSPHKPYVLTEEETKVKTDLQEEVRLLQPIPDAVYKPVINSNKDHSNRWLYVYFNSELDFQEVFNYYDKQLKDNDWNIIRETHRNYAEYRKGKYWAEIKKSQETPHLYYVKFSWDKMRM